MPQFGMKNLGLKFPGAKLPPWPWCGVAHVRGEERDEHMAVIADNGNASLPLAPRKSKGNAVKVVPSESVIRLVTKSADFPALVKAVQTINTEAIIPPPPELRLPQKHFESGSKLQSRILPELKTFQPSPLPKRAKPLKKDSQGSERSVRAPPQLARFYGSIASSLSAFDTAQCETSNWVQKYAPASATEVLQPGQEAFMLRDWLQALTVQSVDTGSTESEKPKAGSKAKGAGARTKKRRKKLDGFIVSSEDEDDELYELSDEDDNWAPSGWRGILRKTVVRSGTLSRGKDADKTANTLVISGPHGCGKTAAVYAVAKELDFEVFEINPSSRRSGKDVLEKIGDMTRNHHVQQHQSASTPDDQDNAAEDDTTKDIKSGKQSTMNAFFKSKSAKPKPKQSAKTSAKSQPSEPKKEAAKTQRQSLILLEEVDILYEEDKQFWNTVVGLMAQSKRPFIMTCNDETLVPLNTLRLHGIFRLTPPPTDLAVDRLILVAANEGHALTRRSVAQLYESRNRDLRAATMDLQYWCQIGVGDRRGGFDWFYPRWPKGVDLDENQEVVRVISQDTYQPGMNLLGRDRISDPKLSPRLVEEEVLHQAWELWGLDIGRWQDSPGLESWAERMGPAIATPADRLGMLDAYDSLAEAMSAADVCSSKAFATFKEVSCSCFLCVS
jgi:DNA polymerase III delta prime subunit